MPTITIPDDFTMTAHGHTMTGAQLTDANALYLLRNGYTQSLGDAGAKGKDETVDVAAKRRARFDAILAGTVGSNGPRGPVRRGLDAYAHDVALAAVRNAPAFRKGPNGEKPARTWPEGKGSATTINGWVDAYIAKNRATVMAEAQRRMDAESGVAEDLADIIG